MAVDDRTKGLRVQLADRGLSPETVRLFARELRRAELWAADNGQTLQEAGEHAIAEYLAGLRWPNRKACRVALGHYWALVGRTDGPLPLVAREATAPAVLAATAEDRTGVPKPLSDRLAFVTQRLLEEGLSPRSVRQYGLELMRAERWCEAAGHTLLRAPSELVAEYVSTRPRTNATRQITRVALGHYWRIHGRKNPPLWLVKVPTKQRMVCRALSDEEARSLAGVAIKTGGEKGFAVVLGLYQALRREEIASVRWSDFHLERQELHVVGKGTKEALLPLHPVVLNAFQHLGPRSSEWVFPGRPWGSRREVRHVSPATIWGWVLEMAFCAGIERRITPHLLRHTCLAVANDNTGDLRAVQDFARHAKPETTAGYTRTLRRRLDAVVAAVQYGCEGEQDDMAAMTTEALELAKRVEVFAQRCYPVLARLEMATNSLPPRAWEAAIVSDGSAALMDILERMRDDLSAAAVDFGDFTPGWLPELRAAVGSHSPYPERDNFR